jgi:hypothetical protein
VLFEPVGNRVRWYPIDRASIGMDGGLMAGSDALAALWPRSGECQFPLIVLWRANEVRALWPGFWATRPLRQSHTWKTSPTPALVHRPPRRSALQSSAVRANAHAPTAPHALRAQALADRDPPAGHGPGAATAVVVRPAVDLGRSLGNRWLPKASRAPASGAPLRATGCPLGPGDPPGTAAGACRHAGAAGAGQTGAVSAACRPACQPAGGVGTAVLTGCGRPVTPCRRPWCRRSCHPRRPGPG